MRRSLKIHKPPDWNDARLVEYIPRLSDSLSYNDFFFFFFVFNLYQIFCFSFFVPCSIFSHSTPAVYSTIEKIKNKNGISRVCFLAMLIEWGLTIFVLRATRDPVHCALMFYEVR